MPGQLQHRQAGGVHGKALSEGEWFEWLYKAGAGWLGWPHSEVMNAPIPWLLLAIDGRIEWQKMISGTDEHGNA